MRPSSLYSALRFVFFFNPLHACWLAFRVKRWMTTTAFSRGWTAGESFKRHPATFQRTVCMVVSTGAGMDFPPAFASCPWLALFFLSVFRPQPLIASQSGSLFQIGAGSPQLFFQMDGYNPCTEAHILQREFPFREMIDPQLATEGLQCIESPLTHPPTFLPSSVHLAICTLTMHHGWETA